MPLQIEVQIIGLPELVAGLSAAPELLRVETGKAMGEALAIAESEIKARTPRKTGRLFSAWQPRMAEVGGQWVGHLGDNVSYAAVVEGGSRPHDIVAHGNALMIPVSGSGFGGGRLSGGARAGQQVAFFRRVRHPGTKGAHMASEGLQAAKPGISTVFTNAINRVLATIKGA